MKFVIWGAGKLGKEWIELLGIDKIKSIIDSDSTLQGSVYRGIPIISYQAYREHQEQYPIIVTPKKSKQDILLFLKREGITGVLCATEEDRYQCMTLLKQISKEYLFKNCNRTEYVYIYGFNLLGIVTYILYEENGFGLCKIILQNSLETQTRKYIERNFEMQIENINNVFSGHKVLLAMKLEEDDEKYLPKEMYTIDTYFDLTKKDLYYNPEIEIFKNRHMGDRCFIIATGPSLRVEDLNILHYRHELCISVNGIFNIFGSTKWRPDYFIMSDSGGTRIWKKEILAMDVKEKFIADVAWDFQAEEVAENMHKWHFQYEWEEGKEPEFSDDFARRGFCGHTVVYDGALQLAVYMGFKEIFLLGTDCKQYSDQRDMHFTDNYAQDASYLHIDEMMLAYRAAKRYADSHGIKIYNATRGGDLEIFERVDFDRLF